MSCESWYHYSEITIIGFEFVKLVSYYDANRLSVSARVNLNFVIASSFIQTTSVYVTMMTKGKVFLSQRY